ncbi:zinc-dependent alcohol dehydrogenase [Bradyrhizobium sp.]|uniref:zinc-dependent alcohol dehydrogenase n=1 Tax=Bradyrhizobium sp. TaxID=376 RepID=UPI003C777797
MAISRPDVVAQALWYSGPGQADIREEALPAPGAGEVRVRALYGAVSRGTEALVLAGRIPASEFERMRAPFMAGHFPFPVKYGYATVGRIEGGADELHGRTVFTLYPHQNFFNVPANAVVALPKDLPPQRAVLAANMETALNAVWDAAPGPADRIAIVGAGVVGSLVAYLCGQLPGAEVTLVDINPARAELARVLGVGFERPETARGECDLVVHASGNPAGLGTALALAGEEATVLELSWYGDATVAAALGGAFHSRRLRLISSQVGRIAPSHRPRWTHGRRLAAALALLTDARLDALLAPAVSFPDLARRLPDILNAGSGVLCQPITYP